jgi:hypothetical protein
VHVTAAELLDLRIDGSVTNAGVAANVSIAVRYLESWLRGIGAAAIDNLMEDAATAEISRSQLWQWIHRGVTTEDGIRVTHAYVESLLDSLLEGIPRAEGNRFDDAAAIPRRYASRRLPDLPHHLGLQPVPGGRSRDRGGCGVAPRRHLPTRGSPDRGQPLQTMDEPQHDFAVIVAAP